MHCPACDLLNGWFDRVSTLIPTFGGTIDKFIGDAVMDANCHVSVDLNRISNNARYGAYFAPTTDGGCENSVS